MTAKFFMMVLTLGAMLLGSVHCDVFAGRHSDSKAEFSSVQQLPEGTAAISAADSCDPGAEGSAEHCAIHCTHGAVMSAQASRFNEVLPSAEIFCSKSVLVSTFRASLLRPPILA